MARAKRMARVPSLHTGRRARALDRAAHAAPAPRLGVAFDVGALTEKSLENIENFSVAVSAHGFGS
jgi:hypothetical protein